VVIMLAWDDVSFLKPASVNMRSANLAAQISLDLPEATRHLFAARNARVQHAGRLVGADPCWSSHRCRG